MGFWINLLWYAVLFVLSELLRPKPKIEDAKPAGLGDFQFPTATEGRVIPLLWGTVKAKGPNVVWYGDFEQIPITERVKTGLFSSQMVIKGYKYRLGMQLALCRGGPLGVDKLLRVWIGDDEVFNGTVLPGNTFTIDCPELFGGDDLGSGGVVGTLRFFGGTPSQAVPSYFSSVGRLLSATVASGGSGYAVGNVLTLVGGTFTQAVKMQVESVNGSGAVLTASIFTSGNYSVAPDNPISSTGGLGSGCTFNVTFAGAWQSEGGDTPAYRGTCYVAPDTENIYLGNSTSIKPWSFELQRIPNPLSLAGSGAVNTYDANPMNVIYEIMTDSEWGLGFDPSSIDTVNFTTAANTLATEGNGFSYMLDRAMEASELLKLLQEQIEGVVFFNQIVGKWQINLARDDYDVMTIPEITKSNRHDLESFARGSWEDTTNEVRTKFTDRSDSYKDTYGFAQDSANIRVLQGTVVATEQNLPGVKDKQLAMNIAWRTLRGLSYPLAKATVVVNRTFYDAQPGSVYAFTDPNLGLVRLPMRVQRVDLGELVDNRVRLDLIQDVFTSQTGSFAPPPDSGWEPPTDDLQAFDHQIAFEAPRAFIVRDPAFVGTYTPKVWAGARRKGPEVGFKIVERHHPTTPAGAFTEIGDSYQLLLIGQLQSSLGTGSGVPLSTLVITPTLDMQTPLEAIFADSADVTDIGSNLLNLILIGNEFMLAAGAQTSGANVQINNVYRGVLDSVQSAHSAGDKVYLLFAGGNLSDTPLPSTDQVHIKLLPFSATDELVEGDATQIAFQMANRLRRPIPPSRLSLDGSAWSSSTSMEANGSGPETYAIDLSIIRRDYRVLNEIPPLTTDAQALDSTFPAANNTAHKVSVRNNPSGSNTLLFTDTFSSTQHDVLRLRILQATDGVIPTTLRFEILANHDDGGTNFDSRYALVHDFSVTTALTGQFNLGALDTNDVSNVYTATAAGTYSFTLSTSFTAGLVEYRTNGGAWTTLITAGGTSGSILGVNVADTIEVRHTSTDVGALKQLDMNAPGAGQDGYAILFV